MKNIFNKNKKDKDIVRQFQKNNPKLYNMFKTDSEALVNSLYARFEKGDLTEEETFKEIAELYINLKQKLEN